MAPTKYGKERTVPSFPSRLGFLAVFLGFCSIPVPRDALAGPRFERDILPILRAKCIQCHGGKVLKGELELRTLGSLLEGGESGEVVVSGRPEDSLLLERIAAGEMPPGRAEKLTPDEVDLIRQWIVAGIPADQRAASLSATSAITDEDRQFWAFRPLKRPAIPKLGDTGPMRTPIDAFVLSRLEEQDLTLSAGAGPVRLLRRVYFDLLGLPPSPEAVEAYLADTAPDAYERLVDEILASPHFGERWGRHWLDTVGYTDTISYDGDTNFIPGFIEGRWRYRDYVVDAFNRDKPYDRFLAEQIAGDELIDWRNASPYTPQIVSTLAATGFWRNAEDRSGSAKEIEYKWSLLHDTLQTFGTSVLGLTLRCARCHTHKYEPIPQTDYYRLLAMITPAFSIENWKEPKERALPDVSAVKKAEIDSHNAAIEKQAGELAKQVEAIRQSCEGRLRDAKLAGLPEPIRDDTKMALALSAEERSPIQRYLAEKFAAHLTVKPEEIDAALSETQKATVAHLKSQIEAANARRRSHGWIQAVYDVGPPPVTRLLKRGDHTRPGREVQPGFLSVLSEQRDANNPTIEAMPKSSGRRLALARWLTARDTPASGLVARVMVNRVWQHLIGVGIVPSSENLGMSGARPTHPELLEWLGSEFVEGGWRIKPLIKTIVMSSVYRQTSRPAARHGTHTPDPLERDPGNALFWKARLRRLESEAIRDSMLVASGAFDAAMGGPPVPLHYSKDGLVSFDETLLPTPSAKWRRSLYLFQRRVYHLTLIGVFDQPVVAGSTCRRLSSAVVLQSLTMLNDALVLDLAERFAQRVYAVAGSSQEKQVDTAFRQALGRPPEAEEIEWSLHLLGEQTDLYRGATASPDEAALKALMHLCRVLFNSTEFLYIE